MQVSCFSFFDSSGHRGVHAWSSRFSRRTHVLATDPERGRSVKNSLSDRQDNHHLLRQGEESGRG